MHESLKGKVEVRNDNQSMNPTRIMLVDNHIGVRMGIITFLESQPDFELVAETSNGKEAMTRFIKDKPDLVLINSCLPDSSGIHLMQDLHRVNINVPVIILTTSKYSYLSEAAITAGAAYTINKDVRGQVLVSAIRDTMDKIENGSAWFRSSLGDIDKLGTIEALY